MRKSARTQIPPFFDNDPSRSGMTKHLTKAYQQTTPVGKDLTLVQP